MSIDNLDTSTALAQLPSADALATWSDDRRKEFNKTFSQRVASAQTILLMTAGKILEAAAARHFIGGRAKSKFEDLLNKARVSNLGDSWYYAKDACGRSREDLASIAEQRAKQAIDALPSMLDAVLVLDADLAKKIEERDRIEAKAKVAMEKLEEIPNTYALNDPEYQNMTVGEFREMVRERLAERDRIGRLVAKYNEQFKELDVEIARKMFKGVPGLSEAVEDILSKMITRANDLSPTKRKVIDAVMFGDSAAAMSLLGSFEHDEHKVSDEYVKTLAQGLEALKVHKGQIAKAKREAKKLGGSR